MPDPASDLMEELRGVAERALRASGMDSVGLYRLDAERRFECGINLGMPEGFTRSYEIAGASVDPVLKRVIGVGTPCSTLTVLGDRWTSSPLYRRVSGRFGLFGFAALPLYREEQLAGVLFLGALREGNLERLGSEGLCEMTPHATQVSTRLLRMRHRHPRLTPRQDDVARLAAQGLRNREIAEELQTGEAAVRKHMKALNRVFGTRSRTAMAAAWQDGAQEI